MKKIYTVFGLLLSMASYGQLVESWSYALPDKVAYSGPAIADDGTIYIACDYGTRETLTYDTSPENVFAINPVFVPAVFMAGVIVFLQKSGPFFQKGLF